LTRVGRYRLIGITMAGRGPKALLGVTLVLCAGALDFLALRRQAEILGAIAPWPGEAPLAARVLTRRTHVDFETWAEIVGGMILLVAAGTLFAAPATRSRSVKRSVRPPVGATRSREVVPEPGGLPETVNGAAKSSAPTIEVAVEPQPSFVDAPEFRIQLAETPPEPPRAVAVPVVVDPPPPALPSSPPRSSSYPELRHELRFTAHVEVDFESESHFYTGLSENLSEGGIFIATFSPRPVGTEMDVTLKLPHQTEPIRTRGTVRWIREFSDSSDVQPGMGLKIALRERDLPAVRRFLSTRPPLFFDDD
jgi:uncharacterized protein (TIGR02266 family)